jgi:hypothetical protein
MMARIDMSGSEGGTKKKRKQKVVPAIQQFHQSGPQTEKGEN